MIIKQKKILIKENLPYWVIGGISILIFISIYGIYVLNPTYTDWLMSGGDLTQHYLGWKGYRNSSWHFPIGMMDTLVYPETTSIIFTDSIPLFAVFFKNISPVLPESFQYFGLWGLLCFIMQGILAARILKNFTNNKTVLIVSSLLFCLTPAMIWRMFAHTALAGHWILLLGLEPIFAHQKYHDNKKIYAVVALLGTLSASVHIYFILLNGIILVGVCISFILFYKAVKKSVYILEVYIISASAVVALLGGFSSGVQAAAWGLGYYSFNLNALFNPMGWSDVYKDLPLYQGGGGQYEGFAYLGAGIILLLVFACISFAGSTNIKRILSVHGRTLVALLSIVAISVIVAQSPLVTFGNNVIVDIKLPDILTKIWSIFRSSGRIAWIVVYVVMITSCIVIYKLINKRVLLILVLAGFILQIYDIHSILRSKNDMFNKIVTYETKLQDKQFWENIANRDFHHIIYTFPIEQTVLYSVTDWALNNQMTVNTFYLAHAPFDTVSAMCALTGQSDQTIFIFKEDESLCCREYDMNYYRADGLIVGCMKEISGIASMKNSEFHNTWQFGDDIHIKDGMDTDKGRVLYPGGLSYGPYWSVPAGSYMLTIVGENLSDTSDVMIQSQSGQIYHDFEIMSRSDTDIQIQFILSDAADDLEILVWNNAAEDIRLRSIELNYE